MDLSAIHPIVAFMQTKARPVSRQELEEVPATDVDNELRELTAKNIMLVMDNID